MPKITIYCSKLQESYGQFDNLFEGFRIGTDDDLREASIALGILDGLYNQMFKSVEESQRYFDNILPVDC